MKAIASLVKVLAAASLVSVAAAKTVVVSYVEAPLDEPEGIKIETALSNLGTRRALRGAQDERDLGYSCSSLCSGWPKWQCYVVYRHCRRRQLDEISAPNEEEEEAHMPKFRELSTLTPDCQSKIDETKATMQAAVSTDTEPIIQYSTDFMCYKECMVNDFALWNADCDVITRPTITDGAKICMNDYQWSVEAIVDDCVDSVKFELKKGSTLLRDRTENSPRYVLFGNEQGDYAGPASVGLNNNNMGAGSYTVTATPDGDTELTKTITFELMEC